MKANFQTVLFPNECPVTPDGSEESRKGWYSGGSTSSPDSMFAKRSRCYVLEAATVSNEVVRLFRVADRLEITASVLTS